MRTHRRGSARWQFLLGVWLWGCASDVQSSGGPSVTSPSAPSAPSAPSITPVAAAPSPAPAPEAIPRVVPPAPSEAEAPALALSADAGAVAPGGASVEGTRGSDAGALAPPASTRGSGGPLGPAELRSSRGLTYRIDAPGGDTAHGLLVLLHGSSASNYATFVPMMRTLATRYDLIPVSVLAPNGQGWNEGDQVRAAELLHALVQEDLYTQYDIDTSRVVFSGQSSGGGFLSSNFVPAHANDYTGGAFFQCGAAPPNVRFAPDARTRDDFHLHFEITTDDPIWPEYYALALAAYRNLDMQISDDSSKPGGHCQFDQQQVILDHIGEMLPAR